MLSLVAAITVAAFVGTSHSQATNSVAVEIQGDKHATALGKTLQFWLNRGAVRNAGDYALTGKVTTVGPHRVSISIECKKVAFEANLECATDDLAFHAKQIANRFHYRVTGKWIPEVATAERKKLGSKDLTMVRESDPAEELNPGTEPTTEPGKLQILSFSVDRGPTSTYYFGEDVKISFKVSRDCYVTVYNVDSQGKIALLFPSIHTNGKRVKGGVETSVPQIEVDPDGVDGLETLIMIATLNEWEFPGKVRLLNLVNGKDEPIPVDARFAAAMTKGLRTKLNTMASAEPATATLKFYTTRKKPSG